MPYKTVLKGRVVFLCCDGCEVELRENPDKYLARLERLAPGSTPAAKAGDNKKKEGPNAGGAAPKKPDVTLTPDEVAQINRLPEADRAIALAQKICPVGLDDAGKPLHLGAMSKPFRTVVKGRVVFLCCSGCETALKQDPDKYLAKIPR